MASLARRLAAEALGTAFLLAAIIGSGIMAQRLAGGNLALALLGNTLPTGAMLTVLILIFGPISGAHLNPAVSLVAALRRALPWGDAATLCRRAIVRWLSSGRGPRTRCSSCRSGRCRSTARSGWGQWLAEFIATFGLVLTILGCGAVARNAVAYAVGLYITAAYWFTASTSFANPAVTIARSISDTFAGIAPAGIAAFILLQLGGALVAHAVARWLWPQDP